MPRNGAGVYSLPPGYLAVPATPILASQHNPPLEDIASEITASLPRSGVAAMTGALTLSADPVSALHAATKQYVDAVAAGLDIKPSVKVSTTANITLSGEQTLDGVLTSTSRVLVKNQSAPAQNGIYVSAAGAWARAADMDSWLEVPGASVWVEEGTTQGDSGWVCSSNAGGTLGSTAITFSRFGGAGSVDLATEVFGNLAVSHLNSGTAAGATTFWRGDGTWAVPGISGAIGAVGGRLTLTTGVPVLVSTVTGATTVLYTYYNGQYVPIFDGTSFGMMDIASELSNILANSATGNAGPAAAANNSNYDYFIWSNAGTPTLTRGPAWTSDTARGSGAGTTELVRVKGVMLNAASITNGPAAQRGTYVGTVRTNGTATVDYQFGALATGGTAGIVGVWNMYNRVNLSMFVQDDTNSWNYTTATWRAANASNGMRVSFVSGLAEDNIQAWYHAAASNSTTSVQFTSGIGYDATNALAAGSSPGKGFVTVAVPTDVIAQLHKSNDLGFHFVQALEFSAASGTTTWYGDNNTPTNFQTGLYFNFRA